MRRLVVMMLGVLTLAGMSRSAAAEDTLKVAIPQKGAWDAGLAELGQRGGIFKKHGLNLDILYTAAGPESIQALIGGSIDVAAASGVSAAIGTFGKGAPIRIISSEMTGAPDLYWYVPADFADPHHPGPQRQDHFVLGGRLVVACLGAGA